MTSRPESNVDIKLKFKKLIQKIFQISPIRQKCKDLSSLHSRFYYKSLFFSKSKTLKLYLYKWFLTAIVLSPEVCVSTTVEAFSVLLVPLFLTKINKYGNPIKKNQQVLIKKLFIFNSLFGKNEWINSFFNKQI
jgi:hypothetical protein